MFPTFVIPTVSIDTRNLDTVLSAEQELGALVRAHPYGNDFLNGYVLKDRYGAGGAHVYKISAIEECVAIGRSNPSISYILQPLVLSTGFHLLSKGNSDLRVIQSASETIQCYIRVAQRGEFRANACLGGTVHYLQRQHIPHDVADMVDRISRRLPVHNQVYALDFIKSASGSLYFLEGNNSPGLIWFDSVDQYYVKELIRIVIQNAKVQLTQLGMPLALVAS